MNSVTDKDSIELLAIEKAEKILAFEIDKKLGARVLTSRLLGHKGDEYKFELKIKLAKATLFCTALVNTEGDFEVEIPSFKIRPDGVRMMASMGNKTIARELVAMAKKLSSLNEEI